MHKAYPRQVILVSCRGNVEDSAGKKVVKDNIITLSWHTPCSFNPHIYAISVGKERFSYKLIHKSKVFVVNFMAQEFEKQILFCGRNSGRFNDKFDKCGFTKHEAEKVDCCVIGDALAYYECQVVNEVEVGDHVLIIGKVLHKKEIKKGKKLFQVKGDNFTTTT